MVLTKEMGSHSERHSTQKGEVVMAKGRKVMQFSASKSSGYFGYVKMFSDARSWVKIGRNQLKDDQYFRSPARTKSGGYVLRIFSRGRL